MVIKILEKKSVVRKMLCNKGIINELDDVFELDNTLEKKLRKTTTDIILIGAEDIPRLTPDEFRSIVRKFNFDTIYLAIPDFELVDFMSI